ncbi:carbamoyltransferase HypF [Thiohalocapsa marina]|uniref:carbamoyltransferase HypF n=1 Tax=Thiohalocapsa marina TaxID=424902 RepID=UPI001478F287|nr:carbamoyltransferase HypF [Thiohalocapsa marina]
MAAESIRVRGLVQGVGFRPTVWRLATELGLQGSVRNDGEGVLVTLWGDADARNAFCERLRRDCPPLARIDALERTPLSGQDRPRGFAIVDSAATSVQTGVVPDAAVCDACAAEIADPANRRFRYAFTNCTHCGPRLSIVRAIPYDRANTSMAAFRQCPACAAEYADPADRRFHAQPNACPVCGPRVWLQDADGQPVDQPASEPASQPASQAAIGALADPIAVASRLLAQGRILALKGIGGVHLACDATNPAAIAELRRRKRRWAKPFALMARDLDVIRRYCTVTPAEADLLRSPAAPIVLLAPNGGEGLPSGLAPGQHSLGFMLPYSPLHRLLLQDWSVPLVMTSGNSSDEPQCINNDDTVRRLGDLADAFLLHDRDIVNRVDDSVARIMDGAPRLLRRARGHAPAPLRLPEGFVDASPILAMGGELKSTLCLVQHGQAVLSQHLGDLHETTTLLEYERTIALYRALLQHRTQLVVVDAHPGYHSGRTGRALAAAEGLALLEVQHHRAHVAAVLADNGWPLDGPPVLGIALDGSGYGDDGSIWGGECFIGGYRQLTRVAHLQPVALPGGTQAILEPWRNLFAQIVAGIGWEAFQRQYPDLAITARLRQRPVAVLSRMIAAGVNSPMTSSCGRLFDAVAAALDICADGIRYEGQAAIELESLCQGIAPDHGYAFALRADTAALVLDPSPMWRQLFDDLAEGVEAPLISARFHAGLADAVVGLGARLASARGIDTLALSGGVFQNRTLFERVSQGLRARQFKVLAHRQVPSNDGGLALGQAAMAAARLLRPLRSSALVAAGSGGG